MSIQSYQRRVRKWISTCFPPESAADQLERSHRFLEESLELAQACGCTKKDALVLVDYVFNRPVGDVLQEAGGVMVTLSALCDAQGVDLEDAAERELLRNWNRLQLIRAKQAAKPQESALPQ